MNNYWYFHPYYISNVLLCLIYPLFRHFKLNSKSVDFIESLGFKRENQIIVGLATLIILRFAKYFTNMKKFVNESLYFLKAGSIIIFFFIDKRLACWYIIICLSNKQI